MSEKPILIVQVEPPQNEDGGDYYYRTLTPGMAMAEEAGVFVVNLTNIHRKKDEIMKEADVLVLKNVCDADLLPLLRDRKEKKRLTVFEIADDIGAVQPWSPVYFFYRNPENLALSKRLARFCGTMQFSVEELKKLYGYLAHTSTVFENHISIVPRERHVRGKNNVTIGWGGSHGHQEDIARIAPSLIRWIKTKKSTKLHLMCSDPIWGLFHDLPPERKRRFKSGSIQDYYRFLETIDIGLAPLEDTAFNRSRSDVKFLEYAVSQVVPLIQDLVPYRTSIRDGETGFLFRNPDELVNLLDRLTGDRNLMVQTAAKARAYVLKERLQRDHTGDRIDFYRQRLSEIGGNGRNPEEIESAFGQYAKTEGALRQGRHLRLMPTRFEMLLQDGLVLSQIEKDHGRAQAYFSEASRIEPINHLPHLFGAVSSKDTIVSLERALSLNPLSLKAHILLGEAYAGQGNVLKSLESFNTAAEIFPEYEIPYVRAAALMAALGDHKTAEDLNTRAQTLVIP